MSSNSREEEAVLKAALEAEAIIDAEIAHLNSLKSDDLEILRERKLRLMKLEYEQQQQWIGKGHGKLTDIQDEKDWFDATQRSRNVVSHFYRSSTWRCAIVDKHLMKIAEKHLETRFIKIDVEKAPFLAERLKLWMLPTIVIINRGVTQGRIEGFDVLGGTDDFTTATMARVLRSLGAFQRSERENIEDEDNL